jgi:hypothetical protein
LLDLIIDLCYHFIDLSQSIFKIEGASDENDKETGRKKRRNRPNGKAFIC